MRAYRVTEQSHPIVYVCWQVANMEDRPLSYFASTLEINVYYLSSPLRVFNKKTHLQQILSFGFPSGIMVEQVLFWDMLDYRRIIELSIFSLNNSHESDEVD